MPIAAETIHHPKKTLLVFFRAMSGVNCANVPYNPLKFGVRPKTVIRRRREIVRGEQSAEGSLCPKSP